MIESLITIQYFIGNEVISMSIPSEELPSIAGHTTYWRQDVLDQDEEERRGKALKARIGKTLKHNALFPTGSTQDEAPAVEDNLPPAPTH